MFLKRMRQNLGLLPLLLGLSRAGAPAAVRDPEGARQATGAVPHGSRIFCGQQVAVALFSFVPRWIPPNGDAWEGVSGPPFVTYTHMHIYTHVLWNKAEGC